jgi:hypothetical protein
MNSRLNGKVWLVGVGIGIGISMVIPVAAAGGPFIDGPWGGDRLQLTADALGVRIETDCASGSIGGRVQLTNDGRFVAEGQFESHQGGPQRADDVAPTTRARFSGEVNGTTMALTILRAGATAPQVFTLRQGLRIKLARCA